MADLQYFLSKPPKFIRNNHARYCGIYPQQAGASYQFVLAQAAADYPGSAYGVLPKQAYCAKAPGAQSPATFISWRAGEKWTVWNQYVEEKNGVLQIRDVQQSRPGTRFS